MSTIKQHNIKKHHVRRGPDPSMNLPLNKLNLNHMKNHILRLAMLLILMSSGGSLWAQYGIGTNTPNASAALDIVSPDKGILIPSITLTSSSTFAPVTGTSSTTHNGMIVWNDNDVTTGGLTGAGFYFWQNDPTTPGVGNWYKLNSTDDGSIPETGTVTNSTLRWDGTNWVETTTLLQTDSATGTATLAANATVTGTLTVQGTTTLATTTLTAGVIDAGGDLGQAGQILTATATGTDWIDGNVPESGMVTNSTLRWDGSQWVETTTLLQTDSATGTATLAANVTVTGTLEVTGITTLTSDLIVGGNTTASGTLTAQSTTSLEAALVDGTGSAGTEGQVLSSTGTSTRWVDANAGELATLTATGSVSPTVSILLIEPGATMTVTLPDATALAVGYELKIRRNAGYTGTNDLVSLTGSGAQTIDGQATRNMNVGYQSLTLLNIGGSWVTIE